MTYAADWSPMSAEDLASSQPFVASVQSISNEFRVHRSKARGENIWKLPNEPTKSFYINDIRFRGSSKVEAEQPIVDGRRFWTKRFCKGRVGAAKAVDGKKIRRA
jgi:hypothetical protein